MGLFYITQAKKNTIPYNETMEKIFIRCAEQLDTTPELVKEFYEGMNYTMCDLQRREMKKVTAWKKGDKKGKCPRVNILLHGLGRLKYYNDRIIKESTQFKRNRIGYKKNQILYHQRKREYKEFRKELDRLRKEKQNGTERNEEV